MISILKDKNFYKHLLLAFATLFVLFFGWLKYLDYYTLHGEYIKVPDFNDVSITMLDSLANEHQIRYEIIDSIFDRNKEKGIVVNQDPAPFTDVKENRKIYLTINSLQSNKVVFPDIYDLSLRQAIRKLEKNGLVVGNLEYKADIATNKVLSYKLNGIKIKIGQEIYEGTTIDLVVGKGLSKENVIVPNLLGLTRIEANIILKSTSLNIGTEIFKSSVEDSLSAVVYKQFPVGDEENTLPIGSKVDLFFDLNKKADDVE